MKTLTEYVSNNYLYEGLSESDMQLLNEGIGSFMGKLFGFTKGKAKNMMSDFKQSYETTLANILAGKKSKDEKTKKEAEGLENELKGCKDDKDVLEKYKVCAETLLTKTLKDLDDPLWAISVKRQLANLGKQLNDKEAVELSGKLDEAIKKHWEEGEVTKSEKQIASTEQKIEKKAEEEAKQQENNEDSKDNGNEVKTEVADAIKEEKDVLGPLAKEAGIEGKYLLEYITNKINKTNKKSDNPINPKSDNFNKLVLGMCITICGAIITNNPDLFAKISDMLELEGKTVKDLKKRIQDSTSHKKAKEKQSE